MRYHQNDGGRYDAGFKGNASDCVVRSIAIATGSPYRETYKALRDLMIEMSGGFDRSVRGGVHTPIYHKYLVDRGWEVVLTPGKYLRTTDIPQDIVTIAIMARHVCAILHGTIHDTWDCRECNRTKCGSPKLLGYYINEYCL